METSNYSSRNPAIDIFRALIMVLMLFVNDLWNIDYPHWMGHASIDEDMLGLSDIVFPCFLIAVGMSIPYALENSFRKGKNGVQISGHILTRTLALLVMGVFAVNAGSISPNLQILCKWFSPLMVIGFFLVWNRYPTSSSRTRRNIYKGLKITGIILLAFLAFIFESRDGSPMMHKWWGILGLIGWSYLVCAFIYYFTRDRLGYLVAAFSLFLLWCMLSCKLTLSGEPLVSLTAGSAFSSIINLFHIDTGALCALVMFGTLLSVVEMKSRHLDSTKRIFGAIAFAILLLALGMLANNYWIISKLQATAPWVLLNCSISVALYTIIYVICARGKENWFKAIKPAGTATLTCYLIPNIIYSLPAIAGISLARPEWLHSGIVGILTCIMHASLCVLITWLLGKLNIKLKI